MKKNIRQQVFDCLNQGKTNSEIYEIFKDQKKSTIKTYITKFNNNSDEPTDKQKNVFLDLEKGMSDYDICSKYSICSSTLNNTYKPLYRKLFNVTRQRNLIFSQLNYAHEYYNESKNSLLVNDNFIKQESNENCVLLSIGLNTHKISFYVLDDIIWLNFLELLDVLSTEHIKFDKNQILINEKYFNSVVINGKNISIIDKNILLDFANQIGDHKFINGVIDLMVTNKDIFYMVQSIINAINLMGDLVKELIETGNSKLLVFEKLEDDILHYIENNELTDKELLEQMKEIKNIRSKRRNFKNIFVLSNKIKYILSENNVHSEALRDLANKLQPTVNDLYNKVYKNKIDLNEEEKKELLK